MKKPNKTPQQNIVIPIDGTSAEHMPAYVKDSALLLRNLMENILDNLYVKDCDSRFILINKAFSDWTGLKHADVIGKTDFDLFSIQHAQKAFNDEKQIMETGKPLVGIEEMETWPDGHVTWVSTTKIPLTNDNNEIIGTFGMSRNITKNKELEGQLVQAQKLESVGHLAAGIAHEINTPIQFVGDNLHFLKDSVDDLLSLTDRYTELIELAKEKGIDSALLSPHETAVKEADTDYLKEELPKAVAQSLEGTDRVSKIVRAMKEFSHPGNTEMSVAQLNEAIETTITIAKNEWKYVAEVERNFAEDLPVVPCLVNEFNQVVLNMIVNARDAIEETGQIGKITFTTTYNDQHVSVRISDTGAGMPEHVQTHIFDPFYTTKEVGKGSGQGLAIAHNVIVVKHGGELNVESTPGQGTTFEIKLPLKQVNDASETE